MAHALSPTMTVRDFENGYDFLEADKTAARADAIAAWTELKELDVPKDYASWAKAQAKRKGKNR